MTATCENNGHLFGSNDRCIMCGDPAPPVPEFLRGAREPDARDAELARLRADCAVAEQLRMEAHYLAGDRLLEIWALQARIETLEKDAAIHAAAWRALGYVLGKFPELSKVIIDEIHLHGVISGTAEASRKA